MSQEKGPVPSPRDTGPSESAPTKKRAQAQDSPAVAVVTPLPLRWARALIEAADGPIPPYGSAEWSALPDDNRTKVAATVLAAESWRTRNFAPEISTLPSRRDREIAEARRPRPGDHMGGPVQWDEVAVDG